MPTEQSIFGPVRQMPPLLALSFHTKATDPVNLDRMTANQSGDRRCGSGGNFPLQAMGGDSIER